MNNLYNIYRSHKLFVQSIISILLFALIYLYMLVIDRYIDKIYILLGVERDAQMVCTLVFFGIIPILLRILAIIYFIVTVRHGIQKIKKYKKYG